MKKPLRFTLAIFLLTLPTLSHSEQPHLITSPQRIITEFAVPVAVPVAPLSPIWYGTSPSQFGGTAYRPSASSQSGAATSTLEQDDWLDRLAEKVAARLTKDTTLLPQGMNGDQEKQGPIGPMLATPKRSSSELFVARCSTCHSGTNPKGNLRLDNIATLTAEQRLRSVRSIITEKMPQGGPKLSPAEAGQLIGELCRNSER